MWLGSTLDCYELHFLMYRDKTKDFCYTDVFRVVKAKLLLIASLTGVIYRYNPYSPRLLEISPLKLTYSRTFDRSF